MGTVVRARKGSQISCKGWQQEGLLRLLTNSVDPAVAERSQELVVYGGTGRAARNWECYHAIVETLLELEDDETLIIQSGKPVAVFRTMPEAPRVVMSCSMLVPRWATWERFWNLEAKGLTMFGQVTAASWSYIGTQGILQATYETYSQLASKHFNGTLSGRLVLTSGLGGMGGAQPLAITMNGGVAIVVEVDEKRIQRRLLDSYCDIAVEDLDEALELAQEALRTSSPRSIALKGNAATVYPEFVRRGIIPDVVSDQTAAHDLLGGYIPAGLSVEQARRLRYSNVREYLARAAASIVEHVQAMLDLQDAGSVVFEYGNNIRAQARKCGLTHKRFFPGFAPEYLRPLYCEGRGPVRWVALSGDPQDIFRIDEMVISNFKEDRRTCDWINFAREKIWFRGLPARCCWLNARERVRLGEIINDMVARRVLKAPVALTKDQTDGSAIAAPTRETEDMLDGSEAIADWPILNGLLNTCCGATLVSIQHGGGSGIGYSIHAGMTLVADGQPQTGRKIERVLSADSLLGIIRYADAGYDRAKEVLEDRRRI